MLHEGEHMDAAAKAAMAESTDSSADASTVQPIHELTGEERAALQAKGQEVKDAAPVEDMWAKIKAELDKP